MFAGAIRTGGCKQDKQAEMPLRPRCCQLERRAAGSSLRRRLACCTVTVSVTDAGSCEMRNIFGVVDNEQSARRHVEALLKVRNRTPQHTMQLSMRLPMSEPQLQCSSRLPGCSRASYGSSGIWRPSINQSAKRAPLLMHLIQQRDIRLLPAPAPRRHSRAIIAGDGLAAIDRLTGAAVIDLAIAGTVP